MKRIFLIMVILCINNIGLLSDGQVFIKNVNVNNYPNNVVIEFKAFDQAGKRLCDVSLIDHLSVVANSIKKPNRIVKSDTCIIIPNQSCDCIISCPECQRDCIDLYILLDISSSMREPYTNNVDISRLNMVKDEIKNMVNNINFTNSRVGILTFDNKVVNNYGFMNDKNQINSTIDLIQNSITYETKFITSIDTVLTSLIQSTCNNKGIVLITDGEASNPTEMNQRLNEFVNRFNQNNVKFYSIDIHNTTGTTESFLKNLSSRTNGLFLKMMDSQPKDDPIKALRYIFGITLDDLYGIEPCYITCNFEPLCVDSMQFVLNVKGQVELDATDSITVPIDPTNTPNIELLACPDFKFKNIGGSYTENIILRNTKNYEITIDKVEFIECTNDLSVVTNFPITIPPNSNSTITVEWTPTVIGDLNCCIEIYYAESTCSVICCPKGQAEDPDIRITSNTSLQHIVNIPDVDCFVTTSITISNTSGIAMTFNSLDIEVGSDGLKSFDFNANLLLGLPFTLQTGQSQEVSLIFKPMKIGINVDVLKINYTTNAGNYNKDFSLYGMGIRAKAMVEVEISPDVNSMQFGEILPCDTIIRKICISNIMPDVCDTLLIIPNHLIRLNGDILNEFTLWQDELATIPLSRSIGDTIKLDGQELLFTKEECFYIKFAPFYPNYIAGERNVTLEFYSNTMKNGMMPNYSSVLNQTTIPIRARVTDLLYSFIPSNQIIFDRISPDNLPLSFNIELEENGDYNYTDLRYWDISNSFIDGRGSALNMISINSNYQYFNDQKRTRIALEFNNGQLDSSYSVEYSFIDPCGEVRTLTIVFVMETSASVVLAVPDLTGKNGQIIDIPIIILQQEGLAGSNVSTFDTKIRFNTTMLVPQIPFEFDKIFGDRYGYIYLRNLPRPLNPPFEGAVLTTIPCRVTLGNSDSTILELYESTSDSKYVSVEDSSGSFRILDICEEGSTQRLFLIDGLNEYITVAPNPVSTGNINLTISLNEQSAISLYITDLYGKYMKYYGNDYIIDNKVFDKGIYLNTVDVSSYPNGVYIAVLVTEKGIYSFKFEVSK